jgi:hypothetical protein
LENSFLFYAERWYSFADNGGRGNKTFFLRENKMIIRNGVGDYTKKAKSKRQAVVQRQSEDFDLAWTGHRVYVLDDHEWFDPHTSSHYIDGGVSRHAMYGPSVITVSESGCGSQTTEYHVNDPSVWAWVRRCIAEGHLTVETQELNGVDNELSVSFV